jgi:hypothetical protein
MKINEATSRNIHISWRHHLLRFSDSLLPYIRETCRETVAAVDLFNKFFLMFICLAHWFSNFDCTTLSIYTYHSRKDRRRDRRDISDIPPRQPHFNKMSSAMRNTGEKYMWYKPLAFRSQSISGVSAVNPLVAFYDSHRIKGTALFQIIIPSISYS